MQTEPSQTAGRDVPLVGHSFDGIQEDNHPVPLWWKWLFIGTIAFSALYLPYHHLGAPGRSVDERYDQALSENMRLQFAEIGELQPDEATLVRMKNDPRWVRVGQSVYRTHCVSCHGPEGGGIVGPNLTDQHYKNVRSIEDILRIVQHGAAAGAMPPWKDRLQLNEQILVSSYVASLRGTTPSSPRPPEGQVIPPWPEEVPQQETAQGDAEAGAEAEPDAADSPLPPVEANDAAQ